MRSVTIDRGHAQKHGVWQYTTIAGALEDLACIKCGAAIKIGDTGVRSAVGHARGLACGTCWPHHIHGAEPATCLLCRAPRPETRYDFTAPALPPPTPIEAPCAPRAPDPTIVSVETAARFFGVTPPQLIEIAGPLMMHDTVTRWDLWRLLIAGAETRYGSLSAVEARITAARQARARSPLPFALKQDVRARDGGLCRYCGVRVSKGTTTFDHVAPIARAGEHTYDNVVLACRTCNAKKGQRYPSEAGMILLRPLTTRALVPVGAARRYMRLAQQEVGVDWAALVIGSIAPIANEAMS